MGGHDHVVSHIFNRDEKWLKVVGDGVSNYESSRSLFCGNVPFGICVHNTPFPANVIECSNSPTQDVPFVAGGSSGRL